MDDLVQWLRAQLDEDEQAARAAGGEAWQWEHGYGDMCNDRTCPYGELATDEVVIMQVHGFDVRADDRQVADHIARHDPARVLREIDAKRRMVTEGAEYQAGMYGYPEMRTVLRLLALPYADRPGYREEWRP
ncbi:DUF6221 family protein [Streptomyces sp. ZSW22]|uniref:DUF6221 family protein n=1 Tax=Streptomyces sp. ZSW22 TaxID=3055050 RepID=UPI0025AFFA54|nr:DUF6221 family protein [Streptomyces sp. ZSW22]MDN3244131.1 DUF6221 family protein [Streptomyces sp. ZSW22]